MPSHILNLRNIHNISKKKKTDNFLESIISKVIIYLQYYISPELFIYQEQNFKKIPNQNPTDYNLRRTVLPRVDQPIPLICVIIAIPVINYLELPPTQIRRRIIPRTINILPFRRVTPLFLCKIKETFLLQKCRMMAL